MAKPFDVQPVDASFGAVVTGIRLAELDEPTWRSLHDTWLKYALLIFPGQFLKKDEQIAFAKRFGPLEFEMGAVSNVREDGTLRAPEGDDVVQILKGNEGWHADSTFKPIQAKGAVFSAEVVPTVGGHTGWADMRAVKTGRVHAVNRAELLIPGPRTIDGIERLANIFHPPTATQ